MSKVTFEDEKKNGIVIGCEVLLDDLHVGRISHTSDSKLGGVEIDWIYSPEIGVSWHSEIDEAILFPDILRGTIYSTITWPV